MNPNRHDWQSLLIGVPYRWFGRDRSGWDCFGLAEWTYQNVFDRICPPPAMPYPERPSTKDAQRALHSEVIALSLGAWREADKEIGAVCLFSIRNRPMHVGLYAGAGRFIHVMDDEATTWSWLHDREWKHRLAGFYLPA